jgi:hypothetical protein
MINITPTFFDAIGTADMERVHSGVICWLLSSKCKAFTIKEQSNILNSLFGIQNGPTYTTIEPCLEYDHIDIYIKTTDANGNDADWIIENKVKSSQGDNQLSNYQNNANINSANAHFLLLTLIDETPKASNWTNKKYSDLYTILRSQSRVGQNAAHCAIIDEYINTIGQLSDLVNDFIANPQSYPNVFTDASLKKSQKRGKQYPSFTLQYISDNNLETLLQKLYFTKVKELIKQDVESELVGRNYDCQIGETHGNAEIVIKLIPGNDNIQFDIAFQNGTFKYAVSKDYGNKKNQQANRAEIDKHWKPAFDTIYSSLQTAKGMTFQKNSSLPRVSITKQWCKDWWKYPIQAVADKIKNEFVQLVPFEQEVRKNKIP